MNVIIIHGSYGKPFENWFPWAESRLGEMGIECVIPTFPTPEYQKYEEWEMLLDYYHKRGYINKNTILIGHSCGAVFIVKYLINRKIHVKGIITVSGYNEFKSGDDLMDNLNSTFYLPQNKLDNIANFAEKRIGFYSDNDPFIPRDVLENFIHDISAERILINGAGHFNASSGYTSFKQVIDIINKEML